MVLCAGEGVSPSTYEALARAKPLGRAKFVQRPPLDEKQGGSKTTHLDDRTLSTAESAAPAALTVAAWGESWLRRREREGLASSKDDRRIWRTHVASERWALLPLSSMATPEGRELVIEWWTSLHEKRSSNPTHKKKTRVLAATTLRNIRQTVRKCFAEATEIGRLAFNPFALLKISRSRRRTTRDPIRVLFKEEQARAFALFTGWQRLIVEFLVGSGLRLGEWRALRLDDVEALDTNAPTILIRYGGVTLERPDDPMAEKIRGAWFTPTKGGKPRRIPLLELAATALRAWLKQLRKFSPRNPHRLVFPMPDGKPRKKGRIFRGFARIAKMLGRPFTWHGCRHTCITSLVAGWWTPPWSKEAAQAFAGHSTVKVTERYVQFLEDAAVTAARRSSNWGASGEGVQAVFPAALRNDDVLCEERRGRADGGARVGASANRVDAERADRSANGEAGLHAQTGVTTMADVDEKNAAEVEGSDSSKEEESGRFSSVVEQRFRNTETDGEEGGDGGDAPRGDEPPSLDTGPTDRDLTECEPAQVCNAISLLEGGRELAPATRGIVYELMQQRDDARYFVTVRDGSPWKVGDRAVLGAGVDCLAPQGTVGTVAKIWPDGDLLVEFKSFPGVVVKPSQVTRLDEDANPSPDLWSSFRGIQTGGAWIDLLQVLSDLRSDVKGAKADRLRAAVAAMGRALEAQDAKPSPASSPHAASFKSEEERDAAVRLYWAAREWASRQGLTKELLAAAMRLADAAKTPGLRAESTETAGPCERPFFEPDDCTSCEGPGPTRAYSVGGVRIRLCRSCDGARIADDLPTPDVDERAPDMATAAAAVAERDALPFGERETSQGIEDDDAPPRELLELQELRIRHRAAVGLLTDVERPLAAIRDFLSREVKS
jgi:integrase